MKKKQKTPTPHEAFTVKFWITNDKGFREQQSKDYHFHSKNRHNQAEAACKKEFAKLGKSIEIISVTYQ